MAISMNEQMRNQREREFQRHFLANLGKATTTPLYQSPFGIWLLSAALVAFGGAFFSAQSSCYTAAENLIESYDKVLTELNYREKRVARAVNESNSLDEALDLISKIPPSKSELSSRSSVGLVIRLIYLRSRTDRPLRAQLVPVATISLFDATIYETNRGELEEAINDVRDEVRRRRREAVDQFAFFPSCSYWSALQSVLGLRPPIATGADPADLVQR